MPWVRFDDQYPIHRKIAGLNDRLYRLANEAVFWCARNLTDGQIRAHELTQVRSRATPADAAELVRRGIWHQPGDPCPNEKCPPVGPDGWVVHDYWDFQPSREQVLKDRQAKTKRQQKWRAAKRGAVDGAVDASTNGRVDASVDGAVDPAPGDASPAPYPPRPEGSGAVRPERPPSAATRPDRGGGGREDQNPRDPANPDWRTLPAAGAPRDPDDAERARRGAAAARANIRRPAPARRRDAFDELRQATPDIDPTEETP